MNTVILKYPIVNSSDALDTTIITTNYGSNGDAISQTIRKNPRSLSKLQPGAPPQEWNVDFTYEYNLQGTKIKAKADRHRGWRIYNFNKRGLIAENFNYDLNGDVSERTNYFYDTKGQLSEQKIYTGKGDYYMRQSYHYNPQGLLAEKTIYSIGISAFKLTYKYVAFDIRGNWIKRLEYNTANTWPAVQLREIKSAD
ncbi:hypothetical protein [Mucilaginibacter sp.]|uniref:hypothetical protein n=1 Tax=Mucilaginibacter sp. TaxID=1882438 RepID=UPI0035BC8007